MKIRKFTALIVITICLLFSSIDVSASFWNPWSWGRKPVYVRPVPTHQPQKPMPKPRPRPIGAPLDAGIVSILLAGAGIAYYTKRKNKQKE